MILIEPAMTLSVLPIPFEEIVVATGSAQDVGHVLHAFRSYTQKSQLDHHKRLIDTP